MNSLFKDMTDEKQIIEEFRNRTYEMFHPIEGMQAAELENTIWDIIQNIVEMDNLDIELKGIALNGSRARGLEQADSDIDIVLEYEGDVKEDFMFNLLNSKQVNISNIPVDINPIRYEETGTLAQYLVKAEEYLVRKAFHRDRDILQRCRKATDYYGYPILLGDKEVSLPVEYDDIFSSHELQRLKELIMEKSYVPPSLEEEYSDKDRLFVDMDGTIVVFREVDTLETLYEKDYFYNLEPNENVLEAVRLIIKEHPEVDVFIMSSVLSDSKYALDEKNAWLDKYLPEIDKKHRIFPPCGKNKLDYIPGGIRPMDSLLDDYTHNLTLWEPPARGIKLLNGINHTNGTWTGNMIRYDNSPEQIAQSIIDIMVHKKLIQEQRPQDDKENSLQTIISDIKKQQEQVLDDIKSTSTTLDSVPNFGTKEIHEFQPDISQVQTVGKYEDEVNTPDTQRLTSWWGDMAMFEPKANISEQQFHDVYEKALAFNQGKHQEQNMEQQVDMTVLPNLKTPKL